MPIITILLGFHLILSGFLAFEEFFVKRSRNFFKAFFLLTYWLTMAFVPFVIAATFGGFRRINAAISEQYFDPDVIYILLFLQSVLMLGFYIDRLRGEVARPEYQSYNNNEINFHFRILALAPILGVGLFLFAVGSDPVSLLALGRFSWFEDPSANLFLVAVSQYFIASLLLVTTFFTIAKKNGLNLLFFAAAVSAVLLYSIITLDRKFIIFFAAGGVAGLYIKNKEVVFSPRMYIIFFILFLFMVVSQLARDMLVTYLTHTEMDLVAYLRDARTRLLFFIEYGDISYFYRASLESIVVWYEHGVISIGALVSRNVLVFLPASMSLGLKPPDISLTFSTYVNGAAGGREGNMPPGFFGLFVVSFGVYWSVFALVVMPFVFKWLDILIRKNRFWEMSLGSACIMSSLLLMRGDDSSAVYIPIFLVMCLAASGVIYRLSWGGRAFFR